MSEAMQAETREVMECDVVIVGAGPSGLSAAIRLAQLAQAAGKTLNICVVEKGSEVGVHILSGAALEPKALNELLPDWREREAPLHVPVSKDRFLLLGSRGSIKLPVPPAMRNEGNYIISLGNFCRWLGKQAEALGVQIFPGFPAAEAIIEGGIVRGIVTGAFGISKDGRRKPSYQPGMELRAKYTIFAEGCRGSLARKLTDMFDLCKDCDPQTYGIGIKELWEITPEKHRQGEVMHTIGWPLNVDTYGGSFVYHAENNQLSIGFIVGLDYSNPYLDPYLEFQKFKTHPQIRPLLEGGRRIAYGARALSEGGLQSVPKLSFPGGVLTGDAAGFLNVAKIKGTHTAMKSGMLAAESVFAALDAPAATLDSYEQAIMNSWLYDELYAARNIRPAFHYGLLIGMFYAAVESFILRGKGWWTFRNRADHTQLKKTKSCRKPEYPAPDGVITFDRTSSVYLANTSHDEDQPDHLTLKDPKVPVEINLPEYAGPEARYCPAGVYEFVTEGGGERLQINAANCVHCKTCDIKDPTQNIVWVTPEGGSGPNYPNM